MVRKDPKLHMLAGCKDVHDKYELKSLHFKGITVDNTLKRTETLFVGLFRCVFFWRDGSEEEAQFRH